MSNEIQLLIEKLTPDECNLITESSNDGKNLWLSGIFLQSSIKNRNGRVYPIDEISAAVKSAAQKIKEQRGVMGELGHPQSLEIGLDRVSHVITEMRMEGTNAIGKARIINTPMGNIAKELINAGVMLGVSSRGAGSVNESGGVSSYVMTTVDIVATPSAPNAYPNAVYESLALATNRKNIVSLAESVVHDEAAQKYFKREILNWLKTGIFCKK